MLKHLNMNIHSSTIYATERGKESKWQPPDKRIKNYVYMHTYVHICTYKYTFVVENHTAIKGIKYWYILQHDYFFEYKCNWIKSEMKYHILHNTIHMRYSDCVNPRDRKSNGCCQDLGGHKMEWLFNEQMVFFVVMKWCETR